MNGLLELSASFYERSKNDQSCGRMLENKDTKFLLECTDDVSRMNFYYGLNSLLFMFIEGDCLCSVLIIYAPAVFVNVACFEKRGCEFSNESSKVSWVKILLLKLKCL